jgi:hypothetical protein
MTDSVGRTSGTEFAMGRLLSSVAGEVLVLHRGASPFLHPLAEPVPHEIRDRTPFSACDGNKQTHARHLGAGTCARLVEAAESCQLSISRPGKPRVPDEPGLPEPIGHARPLPQGPEPNEGRVAAATPVAFPEVGVWRGAAVRR